MKQICALTFAFILLLNVSVPVPVVSASTTGVAGAIMPNFIKNRPVTQRTSSLEHKGRIPNFGSMENKTLQTTLNQEIMAIYNAKVEAARASGAKTIEFDYSWRIYQDYYSVILYTTISSSSVREEVNTLVFKLNQNKPLTLTDVFGINARRLINNGVLNVIRQNPGKYNADFKSISDNQSFYIDNAQLVIVFDKYVLGPAVLGTPQFRFNLSGRREFVIGKNDYITKDLYSLKMIPLRIVCEALGFSVKWVPQNHSIDITAPNFISVVKLDENNYGYNKYPLRSLESAPEVHNQTTYVPISFFEQILNSSYSIEFNGNITFSIYSDRVFY